MCAIAVSFRDAGVKSAAAPTTPHTKLRSIAVPSTVRSTSGWNCTPKMGLCLCAIAATSPSADTAVTSKSGASSRTESPCVSRTVVDVPSPENSGHSRLTSLLMRISNWPSSRTPPPATTPPSA
eukprot:Amastigsp_a339505_54.p5 type:complete len:124 gc:universal Amastigsp_a339505_54:674-303(-)